MRVAGIGALVALGLTALARRTWPRRALDRAVAAWVAVTLASAALAVSPRLAWSGEIASREGVLTTLGLAGLYAAARRAWSAADQQVRATSLLIACATAASAYALLQRAGVDPLTWAAPATYRVAGTSVLRPWGPLGNPILLGIVAACGLAATIARLSRPASDPWRLAPLAAVNGAACSATLSRGAWLAAIVGTLVACIAAARARPIPRARLVVIASLLAVVAAWTLIAQRIATAARVAEGLAPGTSLDVRRAIASAALSAWRSRPVWGVGPDGFALAFPRWRGTAYWGGVWLENPVHAHAVPLQVLATLGLAGVLAAAAMVVTACAAARARWRDRDDDALAPTLAVLATLAAASLTNVVGMAGAVIAATFGAALVRGGGPPRSPRLAGLAAAAGVLVAGALAFTTVRELSALADAGAARSLLEASIGTGIGADAAVLRVDKAVARDAGEDELWRLDADAHLAAARARLAAGDSLAANAHAMRGLRAADVAIRLEPTRASNRERRGVALATLVLLTHAAGVSAAAGAAGASAAWDAFVTAERLAPADALIRVEHARAALALSRPALARAQADTIARLYPRSAVGWALMDSARTALRREGAP